MDTDRADDVRMRAAAWLQAHAKLRTEVTESGYEADGVPIEVQKAFQAGLYDAGLAGITWPADYGGQGLTPAEQLAFRDVARRYDMPVEIFRVGLGMVGPTILDLGTEPQKTRYLPPLVRGEEIWCQLFSEPDAGSDVAGLRSRAVTTAGGFTLNGSKIWTSAAHVADFGIALARTDPTVPKHAGITMFVVDMHAPGVTVKPLVVATGAAPFNQVFFDDVHLPADAVIGKVDEGWAAAVVMLGNERLAGASGESEVRNNPLASDALAELASGDGDPAVRRRIADLAARERAVALLGQRLREESMVGGYPVARGSLVKLARAELHMFSAEVAHDVLDTAAVGTGPGDPRSSAVAALLGALESGIAGGTNEIQRTIIGERLLGLEREPRSDKDVPFEVSVAAGNRR